MKSLNTHNKNDKKGNNENNDNNKNSETWLGFSLSQPSLSNPTTFFNFPSQFNYQNMYSDGNEDGIYPAFPVMPLKSDGSLCLMDAITRSQPQEMAASTTPKLEKFFGGATMVAPEFDNTMYYQQYQIQPQNYQDYSALRGLYPTVQQEEAKESHFGADSTYGLYLPTIGEADTTSAGAGTGAGGLSLSLETKKRGSEKMGQNKQIIHRKSLDTFGQRTSQYRGVTRHRWTGRYEAHLWDNTCKKEGQTRKGRQVYLGGYDMEEKAARAYDLAALKYWGPSTHINFLLENYEQELEEMKNMSRQEYVAHLRRRSSGFSRGASVYRGVTRHHQHGRWQARIGRVAGNKDLYLGTFGTQEDAAEAYDVAAIKFRGLNAVTNFDISRYHVERIMASDTLLAGDLAKRTKEVEPTNEVLLNPAYNGEPKTSSSETTTNGNMLDWKMSVYDPNPRCALEGDGSAKIVSHLSNGGSSVVTSLNSSPSPERDNNLPLALGTQARAHIPIFAAWTDA